MSRRISLFYIIAPFVLISTVSAQRAADAAALRSFWLSAGGNSTLWSGSDPCVSSDFIGTSCDAFGQYEVNLVDLPGGFLSESLAQLGPRLTVLTMERCHMIGSIPSSNSLAGSIPSCISGMSSLNIFKAGINNLNGSIPDMSRLTNLTMLDLSYNYFNSTPLKLPSSLTYLSLELSGTFNQPIMNVIGGMTSLVTFYGSQVGFTGPLYGIGSMVNLTTFWALTNTISGNITTEWNSLTRLTTLNLQWNSMSGSLPELNLPSLQNLVLGGNQFTGPLPASFLFLPKLETINLFYCNQITNIAFNSSYAQMTAPHLTSINFGYMTMTGPTPPVMGNFPVLDSMNLYGNSFTEAAPPYPFSLPVLTSIDLTHNNLATYPITLNNITSLKSLILDNIAPIWNTRLISINLPNLTSLSLYASGLNGPTVDISLLPSLQTLSVKQCYNVTSIHPSNFQSKTLTTLNLLVNKIYVWDLLAVINSTSLKSIDLSGNQLTSLPTLANLTSLSSLNLDNNLIQGLSSTSLPYSLQTMTARNNRISQIPSNIFTPYLLSLDLTSNLLAGPIVLPRYSNITSLLLGSNQLNGTISSLSGWTSLNNLDVSNNAFTVYNGSSVPGSSCNMMNNPMTCVPPSPCTSTPVGQATPCPALCFITFTPSNNILQDFNAAAGGCANVTITLSGQFTNFNVNYSGYGNIITLIKVKLPDETLLMTLDERSIFHQYLDTNQVGNLNLALCSFSNISAAKIINIDRGSQSVLISRSNFTSNLASSGSGVLDVSSTVPIFVSVANSSFYNNSGTLGGVIGCQGGQITLYSSGNVYSNNRASVHGGILASDGGIISFNGDTMDNNAASGNGGGIYATGNVVLSVISSTINRGQATRGGGFYVIGMLRSSQSNITSCTSSAEGGSMWVQGTAAISGGIWSQNTAGTQGGHVRLSLVNAVNNSASSGGAVYLSQSVGLITSSIFVNNSASGVGGTIYNGGSLNIINSKLSSSDNSIVFSSGNLIQMGNQITMRGSGTSETIGGPSILFNEIFTQTSTLPVVQCSQAAGIIGNTQFTIAGAVSTSADESSALLLSNLTTISGP
ncbi:hypothetical protein PROFUN_06811 [Planoprotostelium fungivorum]|uniref:Uncharacterized protein n=1 Tax=Planoprotostelium fungivorum TaxID=1890364 RepID=A0A2P6NND3_9EUKA|nr:hypothetical protein PROFUN_06811 [Planoprotostelium fungivorum]